LLNPGSPLSSKDISGSVTHRFTAEELANMEDTNMLPDSLLQSLPAVFKLGGRISQLKKGLEL
jgi:hypothetical protein